MILRFVLDRKMFRVDVADPAATDSAAETGAIGDKVGMAVFISRLHRTEAYFVGAFELDFAKVPGGQSAVDIGGVHHGDSAIPA